MGFHPLLDIIHYPQRSANIKETLKNKKNKNIILQPCELPVIG